MIRLRKLRLKNFLSHRETEIEFRDETYVIVGENASGKTSILRGIFFALFGEDLKERTNREQLINRRSNAAEVLLEFIHRGKSYRIVRELSRRRSGALLLREGRLLAGTVREVRKAISEELGLSPEMFKNTVFVPQGEIVELLKGRPQERRKILNRLLGLDEFSRKHEVLKGEVKKLMGYERLLEARLAALKSSEKELEEEKGRIEEIKGEIERREREVEEIREKLRRAKGDLEKLRKVKESFDNLKLDLKRVVKEREREEQKLKEVERRLRELEEKKREVPLLREEVELLEPCKKLYNILQEVGLKSLEIKRLREELSQLERRAKRRREIDEELPKMERRLEKLKAELKRVRERIERVEVEVDELRRKEKEFGEFKLKEESLKRRLEELLSKLPEVDGSKVSKLERKLGEAEREFRELSLKLERFKSSIGEAEERLSLLKRGSGSCPVCGGELQEEKRERLKTETEKLLERLKREFSLTLKRAEEVEKEVVELKRELERVKEEKRERERLEREISKIREELKGLKEVSFKESELKVKVEEQKRLLKVMSEVEREIATTKTKLKEAVRRLSDLPSEEEVRKAEERLKKLEREEEELLLEATKIRKKYGLPVRKKSEAEKLLNNLLKKKELLDRVEGELKSEEEFKSYLRQLSKEISRLKGAERRLKSELEKLQFSEAIYLSAERAVGTIEESLREKSEALNRVIGELRSREENLKRLERKVKELRRTEEAIRRVKDGLIVLHSVQDCIHPERGFLREVRRILLPRIAHYCKEFFSSFEFEFGDISISEDLSVNFGIPGQGSMVVEDLSGGQQVAFALALRFAMARNLSHSMELLVLDEPTVHLDAQRRAGLTELLLRLKPKLPQMLIVTHDPELEAAGDRVIRVRNHGGTSVVECEV